MERLTPLNPAEAVGERLTQSLLRQLEVALAPGHVLYGVPVKVLARGNGNDALFKLLDGSGRGADVHLTWSNNASVCLGLARTFMRLCKTERRKS